MCGCDLGYTCQSCRYRAELRRLLDELADADERQREAQAALEPDHRVGEV